MKEKKTLLASIHEEMDRCRELKKEYDTLPDGVGIFGSVIIQTAIKNAERAIEEDDVVKMLITYKELKKIEG